MQEALRALHPAISLDGFTDKLSRTGELASTVMEKICDAVDHARWDRLFIPGQNHLAYIPHHNPSQFTQ